jgi:hypothetical protein
MRGWPWDSTKDENLVSGREVYQLLFFAGTAERRDGQRGAIRNTVSALLLWQAGV